MRCTIRLRDIYSGRRLRQRRASSGTSNNRVLNFFLFPFLFWEAGSCPDNCCLSSGIVLVSDCKELFQFQFTTTTTTSVKH